MVKRIAGSKLSRAAAVTVWITVCMATAQAAEKIRWEDLQQRFGGNPVCPSGARCDGLVEHRSIDVITRDGSKHHTRRLLIAAGHVRLYDRHNNMEVLSRSDVTRIEIRKRGRYFRRIVDSAVLPLDGGLLVCTGFGEQRCDPVMFAATITVMAAVWAYTGASAPVFLVAEGVALFKRPKIFELVE